MDFVAEIVDVSQVASTTKSGKPYTLLEVAYKRDGKMDGKKIFPFGDKEVYNKLKTLVKGDVVTITSEKEGEYWEWKRVQSGTVSQPTSTATTSTGSSTRAAVPAPKSNYETAEERAERQKIIVRQSSISNSISLLKTDKNHPKLEEVLATAAKMYAWVMGIEPEDVKANPEKVVDLSEDDDLPWDENR